MIKNWKLFLENIFYKNVYKILDVFVELEDYKYHELPIIVQATELENGQIRLTIECDYYDHHFVEKYVENKMSLINQLGFKKTRTNRKVIGGRWVDVKNSSGGTSRAYNEKFKYFYFFKKIN